MLDLYIWCINLFAPLKYKSTWNYHEGMRIKSDQSEHSSCWLVTTIRYGRRRCLWSFISHLYIRFAWLYDGFRRGDFMFWYFTFIFCHHVPIPWRVHDSCLIYFYFCSKTKYANCSPKHRHILRYQQYFGLEYCNITLLIVIYKILIHQRYYNLSYQNTFANDLLKTKFYQVPTWYNNVVKLSVSCICARHTMNGRTALRIGNSGTSKTTTRSLRILTFLHIINK